MKRLLAAIAFVLAIPLLIHGATGTVMPSPLFTGTDQNGTIISGGKLCTYLAGTTTPATTYFDVDLASGHANTNPVILNSRGQAVVFLVPGQSYKFTLLSPGTTTDCTTGTTQWSQDNVAAVPPSAQNLDVQGVAGTGLTAGQVVYLSAGDGGNTAGDWYPASNTNDYSSTLNPIGFVVSNITMGATGTIRMAGIATGLSALVTGTTYYVGTTGGTTSTLPVNARRVGVADTTTTLVMAFGNLGRVTVVRSTDAGTQDNWAPATISGPTEILVSTSGPGLQITGIAAGYDGQTIRIVDASTGGNIRLRHQNTGSSAANRLTNVLTSGDTWLAAASGTSTGGWAEYQYDATATTWRMVGFEQGRPLDCVALVLCAPTGWSAFTKEAITFYAKGTDVAYTWYIDGTSNATTASFTTPYTNISSGTAGVAGSTVPYRTVDNGSTTATYGMAQASDAAASITIFSSSAAAGWTNSGTKTTAGQMTASVQ